MSGISDDRDTTLRDGGRAMLVAFLLLAGLLLWATGHMIVR